MQEGPVMYRADLAVTKKSPQWDLAQIFFNQLGVMIRHTVEVNPAAQAGEE
jgi:Ni2+-binding GTPase involved in maturation of urease and hydrogenase